MSLHTNPDGSLLIQNGALVESIECCCEGCIPINSLPTICQVKLRALSSRVGCDVISSDPWDWWAKFGPGPVSSRPAWQESIVGGVKWYTYAIELYQPCCSYRCEDAINIPLPGANGEVSCLGPIVDISCDDTITEVPWRMRYKLKGSVRFAVREMITDTVLQLAFRYNCQTNQMQRRLTRLSYIGMEHVVGRYCVEEKQTWEAQAAYDPENCHAPPTQTFCRNQICATLEPLTPYCGAGPDPDESDACSVAPVLPDVDFDTQTGLMHYCWFHFSDGLPYTWESMSKRAFGRNYLTYFGSWEDCAAMDDPWYVPTEFDVPEEDPVFVSCPSDKEVMYVSTDLKTLAFDPPAIWESLICNPVSNIPVQEVGTTVPGLTTTSHAAGDVWGTVELHLELNTGESGGNCPENGADACQKKDTSDVWPGT